MSDLSTLQLPQLHFNTSQKHANVVTGLDPSPIMQASQIDNLLASSSNRTISNIPYGSIIYHSKDGLTTVFDANGNQLFAAEDANSAQIITPKGVMLAATHVHNLPSGSTLVLVGNTTYVSYQNVLLFEEIDESSSANSIKPLAVDPPGVLPQSYVEGIEGIPAGSVGDFGNYWTVPSNPVSQTKYIPTFLWNGVESTTGEDVLIQPVLQWNTASNPLQWSLADWVVYGSTGDYNTTSTPGVTSGDIILGQMNYNSPETWTVNLKDTSRSLAVPYLNVENFMSNSNVNLMVWLESWSYNVATGGSNSYMPGGTPFYTFVGIDPYGNNILPSSITPYVQTFNWGNLTGLGVANTADWPNTYSQPLTLTTYQT